MGQGVAQGCSYHQLCFRFSSMGLLREVEEADVGVKLSSGGRLGGLLFADFCLQMTFLAKAIELCDHHVTKNGRQVENILGLIISTRLGVKN